MNVRRDLSPAPMPISVPGVHAALDVLRERMAMIFELGHSLVEEDGFTRDELLIAALSYVDSATVATLAADRRQLLVHGAALLIAEIERLDRVAGCPAERPS